MTNSRAVGKELKKRCDGSHEHQPLVDGRAKDAARYPKRLCQAICRGLRKEKMQRCLQVQAVLEVGVGVHRRPLDLEEFHDEKEARAGSPWSTGLGLQGDSLAGELQVAGVLGRLTEHKNKNGDMSSSLAWDDLTGMRLDEGD